MSTQNSEPGKSASQIVAEARKTIREITVAQAREELDQGQVGLLLDVREPAEWEKGHIATTLLARNAQNGTERWHTSEGMAPTAVLNGIVYATSYEGASVTHRPAISLSALRASDGSQLWTTAYFSGSSEVVQLAVEQGHVYLLTGAGFFVLQADDGKLLWSSTTIGFGSSFTIANETIYLNRGSNRGLDAIEASNGHLLWTFRANGISHSPPILTSDGVLCVEIGVDELGVQGELYGLRAKDGVQLWNRSGDFLDGTIATADGVIYQLIPGGMIEDSDQRYWTQIDLTATRGSDGKLLWSTHFQV